MGSLVIETVVDATECRSNWSRRAFALACCLLSASPVAAETQEPRHAAAPRQVASAANAVDAARTTRRIPVPEPPTSAAPDMSTVIRMAEDSYQRVRQQVSDYTCVLVRRERVDGRLGPHEFIYAKVRNRREANGQVVVPFSLYLKFLKPQDVAGREVLFVEGANDGQMVVRRGGKRFSFVTTHIDPQGDLAMTGNRYPITEFGIENLLYRLIETAQRDAGAECRVKLLPESKIDGHPTHGVIVTYASQEKYPDYREVRIFVDKELQLPIHYECYGWPAKGQNEPPLLEQYTYTKLVLNPGLTDEDFQEDNAEYHLK